MTSSQAAEPFATIARFLETLGIELRMTELSDDTFLPGITLAAGCILYDPGKLKYPGDLLHEAGHLAVTTPEQRLAAGTEKIELPWPTDGEEIAAVLWSYAACCNLGLSPEIVFHPDGYKGQSDWLIENFTSGNYIGLPFLEWAGMAVGPKQAEVRNVQPFPHMLNWIRN